MGEEREGTLSDPLLPNRDEEHAIRFRRLLRALGVTNIQSSEYQALATAITKEYEKTMGFLASGIPHPMMNYSRDQLLIIQSDSGTREEEQVRIGGTTLERVFMKGVKAFIQQGGEVEDPTDDLRAMSSMLPDGRPQEDDRAAKVYLRNNLPSGVLYVFEERDEKGHGIADLALNFNVEKQDVIFTRIADGRSSSVKILERDSTFAPRATFPSITADPRIRKSFLGDTTQPLIVSSFFIARGPLPS